MLKMFTFNAFLSFTQKCDLFDILVFKSGIELCTDFFYEVQKIFIDF